MHTENFVCQISSHVLLDCHVVAGCVAPASLTIVTEFYIIINAETRIQPSTDGIAILPFLHFTSDRLESDAYTCLWNMNTATATSDAATHSHRTAASRSSGAGSPATSSTALSSGIDLQALSGQQKTALMKKEKARFLTYANWPLAHPIKPQCLAAAGLYFLGVSDRVKCAFCQKVLHNWVAADDPMEEHGRHFPECPFVKGASTNGQNVGNVPAENDTGSMKDAIAALSQPPVSNFACVS